MKTGHRLVRVRKSNNTQPDIQGTENINENPFHSNLAKEHGDLTNFLSWG